MLKRHQACIDLQRNRLIIREVQVPFLGEADIPKHEEVRADEPTVEGPGGMQTGAISGAVTSKSSQQQQQQQEGGAAAATSEVRPSRRIISSGGGRSWSWVLGPDSTSRSSSGAGARATDFPARRRRETHGDGVLAAGSSERAGDRGRRRRERCGAVIWLKGPIVWLKGTTDDR